MYSLGAYTFGHEDRIFTNPQGTHVQLKMRGAAVPDAVETLPEPPNRIWPTFLDFRGPCCLLLNALMRLPCL